MPPDRDSLTDLRRRAVDRSPSIAAMSLSRGAVAEAGDLWRQVIGRRPALIVADDNTWAAAGPATRAALEASGVTTDQLILPGAPRLKPRRETAETIATRLPEGAAFVAVGSGVVNDLVKYAAFSRDVPYLCVATAASMDGYTSAGAPLSDRGFKITLQCRPPRAVIGDLDILARAPSEMVGWGYGDMAGKVPAGADWILADALGVEPISPAPWSMVQDGLAEWLSAPDALARGAPEALEQLFSGLSLVGLAMETHGSSRPASGADHQIAHLWEMEELTHQGRPVSHGACVGVATVAVLALYEWLLTQDLATLDPGRTAARAQDMEARRAEIARRLPDPEIAARAARESEAKHPPPGVLAARLHRLAATWPEIRQRLEAQLWPAARMTDHLRRVGAPAAPGDIGITPERLRDTIGASRFLRSRYTVLDLLDEAELLERALDHLHGAMANA